MGKKLEIDECCKCLAKIDISKFKYCICVGSNSSSDYHETQYGPHSGEYDIGYICIECKERIDDDWKKTVSESQIRRI